MITRERTWTKLKKKLHKSRGWFECRFHPFDAHNLKPEGGEIQCRWCGKKYLTKGYPYIGLQLTPFLTQPKQ